MEQFQVGQKDVIITTKFLYETYFKDFELESQFMFQDQYGVGEPTEEMIASMYESMKEMNYSRIIAVGGGSVIDISKIFVLKNIFPLVDLFDKKILNNMGNDDLIYTPGVTVFKTDESAPKMNDVKDWFGVSVITSAAPELHGRPFDEVHLWHDDLDRLHRFSLPIPRQSEPSITPIGICRMHKPSDHDSFATVV